MRMSEDYMTNAEFNEQIRNRTLEHAVRVLDFWEMLQKNVATKIVSYRSAKSSTSVGANFRAFCRGRSARERYANICIAVEKADEFLKKSGTGNVAELHELSSGGTEILKIVSKIKSTYEK